MYSNKLRKYFELTRTANLGNLTLFSGTLWKMKSKAQRSLGTFCGYLWMPEELREEKCHFYSS